MGTGQQILLAVGLAHVILAVVSEGTCKMNCFNMCFLSVLLERFSFVFLYDFDLFESDRVVSVT